MDVGSTRARRNEDPRGAARAIPPDRPEPDRAGRPAAVPLVPRHRHGARTAAAGGPRRVVSQPVRARAKAAEALGRAPIPGPGAGRRDGEVNTHFTTAAGKLYALVEAGNLPVEPDEGLESVARSDFGGTLEAGFAAHPRYDPATGVQHAIVYEPGLPVRYLTLDAAGRASTEARIDLPETPMIHDVAFMASSIVVLDLPVIFQPEAARTGWPWLWDERKAARVGLLPRDGVVGRLRWFEAPRCFVFHLLNAYDDGDRTIVDVVRHPRMFADEHAGPGEGLPALVRWTLDRSCGRLVEAIHDARGPEFPRINGTFAGRPYR